MRAQRWRVGRIEAAFKGVGTTYFCIIHITPQRRSISTLRRESRGVSWRDPAAARTQMQTGCTPRRADSRFASFTARWDPGMVSVGLLMRPNLRKKKRKHPTWPQDSDHLHPPEKDEKKKHIKEGKWEKYSKNRWALRAARREKTNRPPHMHTLAFPDTDL